MLFVNSIYNVISNLFENINEIFSFSLIFREFYKITLFLGLNLIEWLFTFSKRLI